LTGAIQLRGLRALGHHGALAGEQDRRQPFEIDLDVEVDLGLAARSDDLADTVDYGAVARVAAGVVADERWRLLERLAQRVGEEVLAADARVVAVTVSLRKLRPPVPVDLASAGVRLALRRRQAFLGLGSNQGDREAALRAAVAGLPDVVAVSPVYETDAVGGPEGQPPYLNLVVELRTAWPANQLLAAGQALEAAAGRDRSTEERHGPRPLDVDVLWIEREGVRTPELTVPHPEMWKRRFVLAPLRDLAPGLVSLDVLEGAEGNVRRIGSL